MSENERREACAVSEDCPYVIEMRNITKEFPGIIANDNITLQLKRGEIHALLGENGAGKSTLMSVLFGLYQPERGQIFKNGQAVTIKDPNDANELGIGMVHQHFKLVDVFTVLDNIILGVEPNTAGFLRKKQARARVLELSRTYGLNVDPDALVEDITVVFGVQTQHVSGGSAHFQDLAGIPVDGNNRGLPHNDALFGYIDQNIGGTQVYAQVMGK